MLNNSNELIGQVLGTCTLQHLLGRGGMGAVYLARQSRPRRTIAVKVILPGLIEENIREQFLIRFRREADAIAALDHINIMPIYEYSEEGDTAYLVMPYVTGGTLRDRLEKSPILSLEEAMHIIDQAAAGLDCAHAQGIIHRDLKPGNILFHADGRLLLADFGLAKVLKDVENSGLSLMTSAGTIIGTPEYLSPEQGTGNPLDARTDVYSLGIVLYHMLAGRVPFTGTSPVAIAIRHAMVEPPPIRQFNSHIPPSVEAVIMKTIAKAPEDRFSSAGELARALRQAASQEAQVWHRPSSEQKTGDDNTNPALSTHIMQGQAKKEAEKQLPEPLEAEAHPEQVEKTPNMADIPGSQDHIAILPTMVIQPHNNKFHNAETEENPPLPHVLASNTPSASLPEAVTMADSLPPVDLNLMAIGSIEPAIQSEPAQPIEQSPLRLQEKPAEYPYNNKQLYNGQFSNHANLQAQSRTTDRRPLRTVIIASFLIVFIIGSLATYQYFKVTPSGYKGPNTHSPQIPAVKNQAGALTATPQGSQNVLPPSPSTVPHGSMIYGTTTPSCDKQGDQWSTSPDANVTCTTDGAQITAKQNITGLSTGTFLEQLPSGTAMPNDFVIQTQVTVNPGSQGSFGIYFRSQSDDHQKAYLFLIDQESATWTFYYYSPTSNSYQALNTTPVPTLLAHPIQGTVTIDLQIHLNHYEVFINGQDLQGADTYTSWYPSGTIGLAVGQGANVTFKNVAIYALP